MELNADLTQPAFVDSSTVEWKPSPLPGVDRRMLERSGDEVAVCATIVRYAAGSSFTSHTHQAGEEFLVLDGVFSDEHGDFPVGHYVRNPPGSKHAPHCDGGCTIFVRLRQFLPTDTKPVHVNIGDDANNTWLDFGASGDSGVKKLPLHSYETEATMALRIPEATPVETPSSTTREVFVVSGTVHHPTMGAAPARTWFRAPVGTELVFCTKTEAAVVLYREGRQLHDKAEA